MSKPQQSAEPAETEQETPELLTPEEVAAILRCSTKTLANDRASERGLPFVRWSGRMIRYERDVVNRAIAERRFRKTSEYPRRRAQQGAA